MKNQYFKVLTYIFLSLLFFSLSVYSQVRSAHKKIDFSGTVYDIETLDLLPFSHVLINKKKYLLTDSSAFFTMNAFDNDTITISNIGYYDSKIVISELVNNKDSVYIDVLMKRRIYELKEIELFSYRTYAEFKRAVLNLEIDAKDVNVVLKNSEIIKKQLKNDYMPYNDSYMNYRLNKLDNGGVVFFSSSPNKGLIPALKKLFNH